MEKWIERIGDKLSGIDTTICAVGIILLIHTCDMKNSLSRIAKEVAADVEAVDTSHNTCKPFADANADDSTSGARRDVHTTSFGGYNVR